MPEMPESGTSSTNKCSDTTDASILNTSEETAKASKRSAKRTRSKQQESGMNDSNARPDPPPRYLVTDLRRLTFRSGENSYQADDTEHTFLWMKFVADYADVTGKVDWEDLEERAHFLNMLSAHCEKQGVPFPLDESPDENATEIFNVR